MDMDASHIQWDEVWLNRAIDHREAVLGRAITVEEHAEVAAATGV